MPMSGSEAISENSGYAIFITSILMNGPEGQYLTVTRMSNGRFGKISDWSKVRSFTGFSTFHLSESDSASLVGGWRLLKFDGLDGLKSYESRALEDIRLFTWNDRIYGTANLQLKAASELGFRPCLMSLTAVASELSVRDCVVLDPEHGLEDPWESEKNWCPLVDEISRELFLMRYFKPRHLYRYDSEERRISLAHAEKGDPNTQYRSPSAPIRVLFQGRPCYLGILHSRSSRTRNYEYATTYFIRFYLLETAFPFELIGMTEPVYFDFYPQGFLYPFQIAPTSRQIEQMDSIIVTTNLHDTKTILFRVSLSDIFKNISGGA